MNRMFTLDEVVAAVNGNVINRKGKTNGSTLYISAVSTDTRTIEANNLYIALRGENFDGHSFVNMAVDKGACAVVVDRVSCVPEGAIGIVVKDTLKALGDLARHYRFKLGCKVIGITGSVGKTTTREMIRTALEPSFRVVTTQKNLNNEIGLPLTILGAPRGTEVLVLEMGMRGLGQIDYLTNIACPDIACITNVGYSHIGILGSREAIRTAKTEIINGLTEQGILMVNGDDPFLFDYVRNIIPLSKGLAAVSVSGKLQGNVLNCPLCINATNVKEDDGMSFDVSLSINAKEKFKYHNKIKLGGEHNVRNACFALLCANLLGADMVKAQTAVGAYLPMEGRGKTYHGKRYTIINDAYNASPESMKAAFANLDITNPGSRKICVVGGMLELGNEAYRLHKETGVSCGKYDFDVVIVTGDEKDAFVEGLLSESSKSEVIRCENTAEVRIKTMEIIKPGDTILFKASHSFGFEKLAEEFIDND